jgi:hypothetical protein
MATSKLQGTNLAKMELFSLGGREALMEHYLTLKYLSWNRKESARLQELGVDR